MLVLVTLALSLERFVCFEATRSLQTGASMALTFWELLSDFPSDSPSDSLSLSDFGCSENPGGLLHENIADLFKRFVSPPRVSSRLAPNKGEVSLWENKEAPF